MTGQACHRVGLNGHFVGMDRLLLDLFVDFAVGLQTCPTAVLTFPQDLDRLFQEAG
jgi:hypothetical protein